MTRLVLFEMFVTNKQKRKKKEEKNLFEHQQKNCSLADSFVDPMALLTTAVVEGRMS